MKIFRQILARLIFWPLLAAGMLFAVFNISVRLMIDEATLRSIVAYSLSEALKGQAEMKWARLSPSGEIQIRGLRLRDPNHLEENLLAAENVFLKLSPISFIKGVPEIKEIIFVAPRLEIIREKDSQWNLQKYVAAYKNEELGKSIAITIHETNVRDAEIGHDSMAIPIEKDV